MHLLNKAAKCSKKKNKKLLATTLNILFRVVASSLWVL